MRQERCWEGKGTNSRPTPATELMVCSFTAAYLRQTSCSLPVSPVSFPARLPNSLPAQTSHVSSLCASLVPSQDRDQLSEFTLEYCMALLLNLVLRSAGKAAAAQRGVTGPLLQLCEDLADTQNEQVSQWRPLVDCGVANDCGADLYMYGKGRQVASWGRLPVAAAFPVRLLCCAICCHAVLFPCLAVQLRTW